MAYKTGIANRLNLAAFRKRTSKATRNKINPINPVSNQKVK